MITSVWLPFLSLPKLVFFEKWMLEMVKILQNIRVIHA